MNSDLGLVRRLARFYAFNSPIKIGRYRLAEASLRFGGALPPKLTVLTCDGRSLTVNPSDESYKFLYFIGEYEPGISDVIRRAVGEGDLCCDLGANLGWHTTLMMKLVGEKGEVHAFEPMPETYELLVANVESNKQFENVFLNRIALGEKEGVVEMVLSDGLPDGHASIAPAARDGTAGIESRITVLNAYLDAKGIDNVDFLKVDIEGSELSMLRGARKLFEQEIPPAMVIEMALSTSEKFGYAPNDIIEFIRSKRDYLFYRIDERNGALYAVEGFGKSDVGANVLCLPVGCDEVRIRRLGLQK